MKKSALLLMMIFLLMTGFSQKSPADSANWIVYDSTNTPMPGSFIFDVAIDWNNNKWVSNPSGGIFMFDGTNWLNYTTDSGLASNFVYSIYIDINGNKWFGTDAGLSKFDGNSWITYNTLNSNIPGNEVKWITSDTIGNIWVALAYEGIAEFDGTSWTSYNFSNSPLPNACIGSITIDANNIKWIGTQFKGMVKFDDTNWTIFNSQNSGIQTDIIRPIIFDQDRLWIGSGIYDINGIDGFFPHKPEILANPVKYHDGVIYGISD